MTYEPNRRKYQLDIVRNRGTKQHFMKKGFQLVLTLLTMIFFSMFDIRDKMFGVVVPFLDMSHRGLLEPFSYLCRLSFFSILSTVLFSRTSMWLND